jgi:hypothetical protein
MEDEGFRNIFGTLRFVDDAAGDAMARHFTREGEAYGACADYQYVS